MAKMRGIYLSIFMLIALVFLSVMTSYIPHHHHNDRICLEQNENNSPESTSDETCQFQNREIEFKGITKINFSFISDGLLYVFIFVFKQTGAAETVYLPQSDQSRLKLYPHYSVKSHKLRGAPVFS